MKTRRSLMDCLNARYPIPPEVYVYCKAGHKLGNGLVHKRQVDRNDRLVFTVCQMCKDIIPMD